MFVFGLSFGEQNYQLDAILNQPNYHCISTDWLHRKDNHIVASLGGESSTVPAKKTTPHSSPKPKFSEGEGTSGRKCLMGYKACVQASTFPSKAPSPVNKRPTNLSRASLQVGSGRKKSNRSKKSHFS